MPVLRRLALVSSRVAMIHLNQPQGAGTDVNFSLSCMSGIFSCKRPSCSQKISTGCKDLGQAIKEQRSAGPLGATINVPVGFMVARDWALPSQDDCTHRASSRWGHINSS